MQLEVDNNEKYFIQYNKNGIFLTGEQMDILTSYGIQYQNCGSLDELINLIERYKDDINYDELDWLQSSLAEFNYYHNTHK